MNENQAIEEILNNSVYAPDYINTLWGILIITTLITLILLFIAHKTGTGIKNFITGFGRFIIDFSSVFLFVALLVVSATFMFSDFWIGLGIFIGGTIGLTELFYFIYLLIDIRDSLSGEQK